MKRLLLLCLLACNGMGYAQQEVSSLDGQQKLEDFSRRTDADNEDDEGVQQAAYLAKHPLNLNRATREELERLQVLDELQIDHFLAYRNRLGKLIDLHELQAVPGWSLSTIRQLLPLVSLSDPLTLKASLRLRFEKGEQSMLVRWGRTAEKSAGYGQRADSGAAFGGSPDKLFLRYQYRSGKQLQFGGVAEKDAGEALFRGVQRSGFDFYSLHFFVRRWRLVKALALGDYSVNLGQGLIQWQGLSLGMGAGLAALERAGEVLRPYSSAGESLFQRGAGLTIGRKNWELTGFYSSRHLSAHVEREGLAPPSVTSFLTSGYHRTTSENENRNSLRVITTGAVAAFSAGSFRMTLNAVHYRLSLPLQKAAEPYNLFAPSGRSFSNESLSYSYTWHNMHLFGEAALDARAHGAFLNGLLLTLHQKADLSLVYRKLDRAYVSLFGDAFTQNSKPGNEEGLYAALLLRPADNWTVQAVADLYRFPWLKYRIPAPSSGQEYALQLVYAPSKSVELVGRLRSSRTPAHGTAGDSVMGLVDRVQQAGWRMHLRIRLNKALTLEQRSDLVWYKRGGLHQQGYLFFSELAYKQPDSPFSGSARMQYFETDGYESRLYAYEDNVLYGFSIPAFSGSGFRYYLNVRSDLSRYFNRGSGMHVDCWLKWSQTVYPGRKTLGDGVDEIRGNHRSDITFQVIVQQSR